MHEGGSRRNGPAVHLGGLGGALLGVLALCACGGGGTATNRPATASVVRSAVHISLTIPARATVAAGHRRGQYISPSTESMKFTASPGNIVTAVNLTSSVCSTLANGNRSCTFSVAAPVGNDTFSVVAYDQLFTGDSLPAGANALSGASSFSVVVAEGSSNVTVPLITGGIPATIAIGLRDGASTASFDTSAKSQALTVTAYDADGNAIIAPGGFSDTTGNPVTVSITSSAGSSTFGYEVTSAASGTTSAPGATIALAEPDDTVSLVWSGGYVPPTDTLTLPSGLTIHESAATTATLSFGYRFTPATTPSLLAPMDAAIATALGHRGIITATEPNRIGFEGDITASCIADPSISSIGGLSLDPGATPIDTRVYASVATNGPDLQAIKVALGNLIESACGTTFVDAATNLTPGGFAAYGGNGYAAASYEGALDAFSFSPLSSFSSFVDTGIQSTLFTPRAIAVRGNGDGLILVAEKRTLTEFNSSTGTVASHAFGTATDPYPFGIAVDTTNDIVYANDTAQATFGMGGNGGIDSFSSLSSSTPTGSAKLNAALTSNSSSYQNQNMTIATRSGGLALFVLCADGIEVFPVTTTGFAGTLIAPVDTITTPAPATNIVDNFDGRLWVLLNDGTIDVLPLQ